MNIFSENGLNKILESIGLEKLIMGLIIYKLVVNNQINANDVLHAIVGIIRDTIFKSREVLQLIAKASCMMQEIVCLKLLSIFERSHLWFCKDIIHI